MINWLHTVDPGLVLVGLLSAFSLVATYGIFRLLAVADGTVWFVTDGHPIADPRHDDVEPWRDGEILPVMDDD